MYSRGGRDARVGVHQREQVEPDHHHRGADDREDLVAPAARDQLARSDRGDQQASHHGQQLQPGCGWAGTVHDLEEERQVRDRAEQREPDDQPDEARRREDAVAEQPQRQHRLGGASLGEDEAHERDGADHAEPDDLRRSPGVGVAPERGQEHDRAQPGGQQARPEVVDRVAHALGDRRQRQREHDERRDPERDVDEEDPAPREMGREEAADQRACDAGEAEDRAEDALVAATVARRDDVSDRRLCRHHQAAAPEPLHRPERDQLGQVLRDPAQDRADQEHHQPDLEHDLAAVQIAELPVQRRHDRLREQVRRHDPADVVEPSQLSHDRRERGRDDRAVQRRQQHHQHEAGEDDVDVARALFVRRPDALGHACGRRLGHQPSLFRAKCELPVERRLLQGVTMRLTPGRVLAGLCALDGLSGIRRDRSVGDVECRLATGARGGVGLVRT